MIREPSLAEFSKLTAERDKLIGINKQLVSEKNILIANNKNSQQVDLMRVKRINELEKEVKKLTDEIAFLKTSQTKNEITRTNVNLVPTDLASLDVEFNKFN